MSVRDRMIDWLIARGREQSGPYSKTSMAADVGESYDVCAAAGWPCSSCCGSGNCRFPSSECEACKGSGVDDCHGRGTL